MPDLWYVRSYFTERNFFTEEDEPVCLDEGPWSRELAELVLADIGIDASIERGLGRVRVERAVLVAEAEV